MLESPNRHSGDHRAADEPSGRVPMIRKCLVLLMLLVHAVPSNATVFVNRALTGAPDCAYTVGDYHVTGAEYWHPNFQNAYGSCTGLQPGPPFILERALWIDPGASLTMQDIDVMGDFAVSVDSGGRLEMLDSELAGFARLNIYGAVAATGSAFVRSLTTTAILMQGSWDVAFSDCNFDLRNTGTTAILGQAASVTTPPVAVFQNCTFSHPTPLTNLLSLAGGSVLLEECTFDQVAGNAVQLNAMDDLRLRFNTFESVSGEPVRIRSSGIRELRGNAGTGNGLNALVLAYSNGWVEPASTGTSAFSTEPQFPILIHGTLTVPSDLTLELEPQTVLKFQQSGSDVLVRGVLNATSAILTSSNDLAGGYTGGTGPPQPGDWAGILVEGEAGAATPTAIADFNGCTISYAGTGGSSGAAIRQLGRSVLTVSNSTISDTEGDGIAFQGGHVSTGAVTGSVENSRIVRSTRRGLAFFGNDNIWSASQNEILANGVGIRVGGTTVIPEWIEANRISGNASEGLIIEGAGGAPLIVNNVICANGLAGISKPIWDDVGGSRILNNHIYGNGGDGIRLRRSAIGAPPPVIVNTLIAGNVGYGINEVDASTNSAPRHVDFFGNASGLMRRNAGGSLTLEQIDQLPGAGGNLAADPLLTVVAQGTIDAVTYDPATGRSLLTDIGATFADLSGLAVNPDLSQHRRFLVYASTGSSLEIEGDVTAIAAVGDGYDVVADVLTSPTCPLVDAGESHPDLTATDLVGNARVLGPAVDVGAYELDAPLAVDARVAVSSLALEQNYPNPCHPQTEIRFHLPAREFVRLRVFDLRGRRVAELVNGERDAGLHQAVFDATSVAAGLYFYRLDAGSQVLTRRMVVVK